MSLRLGFALSVPASRSIRASTLLHCRPTIRIHRPVHAPFRPIASSTPPSSTTPPSRTPLATPPPPSSPESSPVTLLYDGECPLCLKEINFLRNRQTRLKLSNLKFIDIASPSYDPSAHADISYERAMGVMHAIDSNGKIVTGVPVFRLAYDAVGLGWMYAFTEWPVVRDVAVSVYNVWAKYRLRLSGRPELSEIIESRRKLVEKGCVDE